MSILRVGLVTLVLVLLGAGAVAVGVALDPGTKALPPRSMGAGRETAPSGALSPQQQKKVEAARKQFAAERKKYAELRKAGAPKKQLEAQRAKVDEAGAALRALGVEPMRGRMMGEGGGCGGGGSCSHGAKAEGTGGGCSMGTKEESPNHNAAAQKEARAGQAGKSAKQEAGQAGHAGHATGHGGAAVGRGGDAAGHDGGHSAHGGAAKAQGIRLIGSARLGRGAGTVSCNDCCQQKAAQCGGKDSQGCCGDCTCCDGEHGEETSVRS